MTNDWLLSGGRVEEDRPRAQVPVGATRAVLSVVAVAVVPPPDPLDRQATPHWTPLGPSEVFFGSAAARPVVSGRVRAIAANDDGIRAYVGTANGGVWYTHDGGVSWTPVDQDQVSTHAGVLRLATALSIGAIHVVWGAGGSSDFVVVGTGEDRDPEADFLWSQSGGVGIREAEIQFDASGDPVSPSWVAKAAGLEGESVRAVYRDPDGDYWAATSSGLWHRPAAVAMDWARVAAGANGSDPGDDICDVVVDIAVGPPFVKWLAARQANTLVTLLYSYDDNNFTLIPLPGGFAPLNVANPAVVRYDAQRAQLAVAQRILYVLAGPDRLWRIDIAAADVQPVDGVPRELFGANTQNREQVQDDYDMAIAIDPSDVTANRVIVGGSGVVGNDGRWSAALFLGALSVDGAGHWTVVATPIGQGIHADVQCVTWSGTGTVWLGCDGGVFRSGGGPVNRGFWSMNFGLPTLEAGYLAQMDAVAGVHGGIDGMILVGSQDNGALVADSPSSWRATYYGDGGGVAIDPVDAGRLLSQRNGSDWARARGHERWVAAHLPLAAQSDDTQFYGGAAVVIRSGDGVTQLAIGTQRVWYSEGWGETWVSLPGVNAATDQFPAGEVVVTLRWVDVDRLLVLTSARILLLTRAVGTWTQAPALYDEAAPPVPPAPGGPPSDATKTDVCPHDGTNGGLSFYLATGNPSADPNPTVTSHVWWRDRAGTWHDCGLVIDAPVHALVVDPSSGGADVYAGTTIGVFRGVLILAPNGAPSWTWSNVSGDLPEAPVGDLVIHGASRMLRVALSGRGVFQAPLDANYVDPSTGQPYLRAFSGDLRLRPREPVDVLPRPRPGASRPYVAASYLPIPWDASPDIRIRRSPGAPHLRLPKTGVVDGITDLAPDQFGRDHRWLHVQAAIRGASTSAGQDLSPVSGIFEGLDNAAVTHAFHGTTVTRARWDRVHHDNPGIANVLPFRDDPTGQLPSAGEATVLILDEPDATGATSCFGPSGPVKIDVAVHTRDAQGHAADVIKVWLLRSPCGNRTVPPPVLPPPAVPIAAPAPAEPPVAPLPANWAQTIEAARTGTTAPWPAAAGWAWVNDSAPFQVVTSRVTDRQGGAVSFPADLPPGNHLIMAVVMVDGTPLAVAETDPYEVARLNPFVALRSVRVEAEPTVTDHVFREWHVGQTAVAGFLAPTMDGRRFVEDRSTGSLVGKQTIFLDFGERAVTAFRIALAAGQWRSRWEIRDAAGALVATHPTFNAVNFRNDATAAAVTNGQGYAWLWDGRNGGRDYVQPGTYRSVLTVALVGSTTENTYETEIEVKGNPYLIHVFARPKDNDALAAALAGVDPVDGEGARISTDCWITVHRGGESDEACVFLGEGCMEPTIAETGTRGGAVCVPRERALKAWIRTDPGGSSSNPDRLQVEDVGVTTGTVALDANAQNPYWSIAAGAKDGIQVGPITAARVDSGTSPGHILVCTIATPNTSANHAWNGVPAYATAYGSANPSTAASSIPPFLNKQSKRTAAADAADALLVDNPEDPLLSPGGGVPPLHFQSTFQAAVFGGLRYPELRRSMNVAEDAGAHGGTQMRATWKAPDTLSWYETYHRAVFLQHMLRVSGTDINVDVWIPRTVIRDWNNNRRLLLVGEGRLSWKWTLERDGTVVQTFVAGEFTAIAPVGHSTFTWPAGSVSPGNYRSVIAYHLALHPAEASDSWTADRDRSDLLSPNLNRISEALDGLRLVGTSIADLSVGP